jgi:hypothetical protein
MLILITSFPHRTSSTITIRLITHIANLNHALVPKKFLIHNDNGIPSLRTTNFCFSVSLPEHSKPRPLIQFPNRFTQSVGLLGRVIGPSQGHNLHTQQHKHRINAFFVQLYGILKSNYM